MGGFWTDSTNWSLFELSGQPAVLPGEMDKPLELRVGANGFGLSNSSVDAGQQEVAAMQMRGGVDGKAGYRLDLGWTSQKLDFKDLRAYEAGRLRWGFDLGTAFGPDRLVAFGIGLRARVPSNQTQDSSGTGLTGTLERWQPGLEAARFGVAFHMAEALTLAGRLDASADVDTLLHTTSVGWQKTLHRFVVARFPVIGLGAQFRKDDVPVEGIADVTFGTVHRMGVMKLIGGPDAQGSDHPGVNTDFPKLVSDSLRILVGMMGRYVRDEHTVRPLLVIENASLATDAFAPVPGTKDIFAKGAALPDTGWTTSRFAFTLGSRYTWEGGVSADLEYGRISKELAFEKGMKDDHPDQEHVDQGVSIGFDLSHRLIPALAEKVPEGQAYQLRMGWERWSVSGWDLQSGFLGNVTTGYEAPSSGYSPLSAVNRGWAGQEEAVGLDPDLGMGADLSRFSFGFGASFADGTLSLDGSLQVGTLAPDAGKDFDLFGWRTELRWSP